MGRPHPASKASWWRGYWPLGLVLLIAVLAFLLRLVGIGYGLPNADRVSYYFPGDTLAFASHAELNMYQMLGTPHPDEADVLGAISNLRPERLDLNPHYPYWGTLHFYVLALWLKTASILHLFVLTPDKKFYFLHPDEFARMYLVGRFLSVVLASLIPVVVYLIGRQLFGRATGLLAALAASALPFFNYFSVYMIPDIPMLFWSACAIYFSSRLAGEPKQAWYALAGVAGGLAAANKYPGFFALVPLLAAHLMAPKGHRSLRGRLGTIGDPKLLLAVGAAAAVFFLGNPYLLLSLDEARSLVAERSSLRHNFLYLASDPLGAGLGLAYNIAVRSPSLLWEGMGPLLAILSGLGLSLAFLKRGKGDLLLLAYLVPFYLSVSLLLEDLVRYLLPLMPYLALLGSRAVAYLLPAKGGARAVLLAVLFVLMLADPFRQSLEQASLLAQRDTREEAAAWILANVPEGATIGVVHKIYEAPPLSQSRYIVREIGYLRLPARTPSDQFPLWAGQAFDYLVFRAVDNFRTPYTSYLRLLGGHYSEIARLARQPILLGLAIGRRDAWAQELTWLQPEIIVLKRDN